MITLPQALDYLIADRSYLVDGVAKAVAQSWRDEDDGYSRFVDAGEESSGVSVAIGGRSETKNVAVFDPEDPFADPLA